MTRHLSSTQCSKWGFIFFAVLVGLVTSQLATVPAQAGSNLRPALAFAKGDVFAGVGAGKVKHFSSSGTLIETLDTTTGSGETTGMCFDKVGNLYSTNFDATSMSKFDVTGKLVSSFGTGFYKSPESCVLDAAQNVYVGQADGNHQILKFSSSGALVANYSPAIENRGTDWIDLASDQCNLFYTSEGSQVKRFNVCTNAPLADFATGLSGSPCFALRIRSNGEVMVACQSQVNRLNSSGALIGSYPASAYSDDYFFALNLDPDGTSFWTGGQHSGKIHKIDIASGKQLTEFGAGILGKGLNGLAVFGELTQAQPTPTPGPVSTGNPVTFQRDVSPSKLTMGQGELTVNLSITGDSSVCGAERSRQPLDIVLTIDRSGSMGSFILAGKLDAAKAAAKTFLSKVNLGTDQVSIVEFNGIADMVRPLDTDRAALERAIDSLVADDGTAIDQGVEVARQELKSARRRTHATGVIILLSDGGSDYDSAIRAAESAKKDGLRVVTIGLGSDANQDLLRGMASTPTDYYYAPDANALGEIYTKIADSIKQFVAATNLTLTHTFDATAFQMVPGSLSPLSSTVTANKITWKIDSLGDSKQTLTYRLKPTAPGQFNVDLSDVLNFTQCEKTPSTITEKPGLPVQIALPPPSPTRPPTATRAPTMPPPPPTATPTLGQVATKTVCDYGSSVLALGLCIGLPILLFLLWWLWRILKEFRLPKEKRNPCPLIWWLFLPLLLILLYLILSQFLNASCLGGESVYFWRIDPNGSSGIYLASQDGLRPAQSFTTVNQGGCVACHAVSSTSHRIAAIRGGGTGPVVVYGLDGKPVSIPGVTGSFVNWSPDGNKLAVSTDRRQIVIVDLEQNTVTPLAGASEPGIGQLMPAWSSDGSTIAFVRSSDPSGVYRSDAPTDIYTVPSQGGVASPLLGASGQGFSYYPAYSPDGNWLAFTHHISGTTTYSDPFAEIFLVPSGGGTPIRIAANDAADGSPLTKVSNSWPTWARDGKQLAFNSKRNGGQYDIFTTVINSDGTSGAAVPLAGATDPRAFEHLPFWGEPPLIDPWAGVFSLWPCLFPFLLVPLLYLLCRYLHRRPTDEFVAETIPVRPPPGPLPPLQLNPTWQVAPTLVIGVGGTGRWVLTHLKKTLLDGGVGKLPAGVRFVHLDTSEEETNAFMDANGKPQAVEFAGVRLESSEIFLFRDNLQTVIREAKANAPKQPGLEGWLPTETYAQLSEGETDLARGTRGRRPLARAGLVKKLIDEADRAQSDPNAPATLLWGMLNKNVRDVLDNHQVRIILVGSLAGGMSGVLFDLAHLARQAGRLVSPPSEGTVTVEGYFATAGAFAPVEGNAAQRQVNTYATARELQRFQMPQDWPIMMRYRPNSKLPLESKFDRQMFEDVFLFGIGGQPETGSDKDGQPWATTFASMADVIAFRMDRGVGAGGDRDYRDAIQKDANVRQRQKNVAFVGGAGSFIYRLPMYDIVKEIKTEWAYHLLHEFIQGTEGGAASSESLQEDIAKFFRGEFGCGNPPEGMQAIRALSAGARVSVEREAVNQVPGAGGSSSAFRDYLQHALGLILNGKKESRTVPTGRVHYTVQFLGAILARCKSAAKVAGEAEAHAKPEMQAGYTRAKELATQWQGVVQGALNNLRQQRDLLEGRAGSPDQKPLVGAYQRVANLKDQALARRAQMNRVAVREYLWWQAKDPNQPLNDPQNQVDLVQEWYAKTADQHIKEYMERFYWEFTPEGAPKLSLIAFEGQCVTLGPDSPDEFVEEVLRLGDHVVRDIWDSDKGIKLAQVMRGRLMIEDQEQSIQTAERMWQTAKPHLASRQSANARTWNAAFGLPRSLEEPARELASIFANLGTIQQKISTTLDPTKTTLVSFTDQYATMLVRTLDLVAVSDIPEMEDARRLYEQSLKSPMAGVEGAELEAVFAAERRALAYEKRLSDPNIARLATRQFHPLVVNAIESETRARLFALAYASGWITIPEADVTGNILLTLPGSGGEVLGEKKSETTLACEVIALLNFCQHSDARLIEATRVITTNPDDATLDAWRAYYNRWHNWTGTPPMDKSPQELKDLGAFTAIVVYDVLRARVKK